MVAMISSDSSTKPIVERLAIDFPDFKFKAGSQDHWSPSTKTIIYNSGRPETELAYSLLHELSHALLGHRDYASDFELLKLESEAWTKAAELGVQYGVPISDEHIQNCLDTYRDWLHRRSTCPDCGMHVMQQSSRSYRCFNCNKEWSVTGDRFVRAYRKSFDKKKYS